LRIATSEAVLGVKNDETTSAQSLKREMELLRNSTVEAVKAMQRNEEISGAAQQREMALLRNATAEAVKSVQSSEALSTASLQREIEAMRVLILFKIEEQKRMGDHDTLLMRSAATTREDNLNKNLDLRWKGIESATEASRVALEERTEAIRAILEEKTEAHHAVLEEKLANSRAILEEKIETSRMVSNKNVELARAEVLEKVLVYLHASCVLDPLLGKMAKSAEVKKSDSDSEE